MVFSTKLLERPEAKSKQALQRIDLAKTRVQLVLDRERVSHQKTLEQKISDQGPAGKRVDPHLLGLAIFDLKELGRLKTSRHKATIAQNWYSNVLTKQDEIDERLDTLAPLYKEATSISNQIGDALEIITEKSLIKSFTHPSRHNYLGHFDLESPKNKHNRFKKSQPPKSIGEFSTIKEADFILFGFDEGPICIECKNYREWFYPHHAEISSTIIKSYELGCIPLFIARRIQYATRENFFSPAGILFHESFYQYYPSDQEDLAARVKDKTLLGFTDVKATESPDKRTTNFFTSYLPNIIADAADRWAKNRDSLYAYALDQMNLAQLYTEIGRPAGGKWREQSEEPEEDEDIPF